MIPVILEHLNGLTLESPFLGRILWSTLDSIVLCLCVLVWFSYRRSHAPRTEALAWQIVFVVAMLHMVWGPTIGVNVPPPSSAHSLHWQTDSRPLPPLPSLPSEFSDAAQVQPTDPSYQGLTPLVLQHVPASQPWTAARILLVCWAAGTAFVGARHAINWLRLSVAARRASPAAPWLQEEFRQACDGLAWWWRPRLIVTDAVKGPAVAGILRPTVLLPCWFNSPESRPNAYWALRHEITHVRHGDTVADVVRRIACTLSFFNPLIWIGARRWEAAAELACDDAVPVRSSDAPAYAEFLLRLSDRIQTNQTRPVNVGLTVGRTNLARRIAALLSWTSARATFAWQTKLLLFLASAALLAIGFQWQEESAIPVSHAAELASAASAEVPTSYSCRLMGLEVDREFAAPGRDGLVVTQVQEWSVPAFVRAVFELEPSAAMPAATELVSQPELTLKAGETTLTEKVQSVPYRQAQPSPSGEPVESVGFVDVGQTAGVTLWPASKPGEANARFEFRSTWETDPGDSASAATASRAFAANVLLHAGKPMVFAYQTANSKSILWAFEWKLTESEVKY